MHVQAVSRWRDTRDNPAGPPRTPGIGRGARRYGLAANCPWIGW
ncbi:hypothetical protein [Streptomyces sp. BA2]|nr:hypothetical protein [Streptomyces sp. BA2]